MSMDDLLKLVDILKWPAVAVVGLLIFRAALVGLIARVQRAAAGARSLDFGVPSVIASEQQQQKQLELAKAPVPAQTEDGPPPAPSPALRPIEESIATAAASSKAPEEIKRAWLVRAAAAARLEHAHEITYRSILGSQITLLLQANAPAPVDMDAARQVYDATKDANPELYKNFAFDEWVRWPATARLMDIRDQPSGKAQLQVTEIGKDFLHYLVRAGLTLPKAG
ncbi:hypothetical protein H8A95_21985 [Bradyrhizobium sp. Pear76]|uniref:hypothetical protein n=1 Tax=Bradyrhizobium oropedii TaxID=1571201 RepID=UPI001E2FF7D4|nr:hypothetical protein [Bradyrhizobium oropedii]MCC8964909.1 hypothetical protein [Bradyrhizobium oropedii]